MNNNKHINADFLRFFGGCLVISVCIFLRVFGNEDLLYQQLPIRSDDRITSEPLVTDFRPGSFGQVWEAHSAELAGSIDIPGWGVTLSRY